MATSTKSRIANSKTQVANVVKDEAFYGAAAATAFATSQGEIKTLEEQQAAAMSAARGGQLKAFIASLDGCPKVTQTSFKEKMRAAALDALIKSGRYTDKSAGVVISLIAICTIGVTNAVMPNGDETTLQAYAKGLRERLPAELYQGKAGSGRTASDGTGSAGRASGSTAPGQPANKGTSLVNETAAMSDAEALRLLLGRFQGVLNADKGIADNQINRLSRVLRHKPLEFWAMMDKIALPK